MEEQSPRAALALDSAESRAGVGDCMARKVVRMASSNIYQRPSLVGFLTADTSRDDTQSVLDGIFRRLGKSKGTCQVTCIDGRMRTAEAYRFLSTSIRPALVRSLPCTAFLKSSMSSALTIRLP